MSEAWTVDPDSRAQLSTDVRERSIAALARRQHGAALSHRDAGHLRNLRHSQNARIEVTVPAAAHPRRPGLRVHRTTLAPENLTIVDGIPVTSLARTRSSTSQQSSSPTSSPEPSRPPSASASWTTHRSTPSSPAIPDTPAPATCAPHWPPTPKARSPRAITRPCSCTSAPPMACRDRRPTARSRSAMAPPSAPMPTGPPTASSSRSTSEALYRSAIWRASGQRGPTCPRRHDHAPLPSRCLDCSQSATAKLTTSAVRATNQISPSKMATMNPAIAAATKYLRYSQDPSAFRRLVTTT